ncbi:hypothetical protein [Amycolatopsis sp. NPDC059657]|uniref:hypothetical protein n=1 Tax=Amycolatopsis sp. NPDC059657 TaxID=3346899 RepID=UPI0036724E2E
MPVPAQGDFRLIMAIGCGAALVALAIAVFLPTQRLASAQEPHRSRQLSDHR